MPSKVVSKVQMTGQGRVWMQPSAPGTPFLYGGCYGLGDVTVPEGDLTPIFCPSPTQPNKWDIIDFIVGTPGNPTASLEAPLDLVNYLLKLNCPFGMQFRIAECETPESPTAWETLLNFRSVRITSRGVTNLNVRDPANNNLILTTADITFEKMTFVKRMAFSSVNVGLGLNADLLAISFCDEPTCAGNCGAGSDGCQVGYAVSSGTGDVEQIIKTIDGGATWDSMDSPFSGIYDNLIDVQCKGDLVIAVNGTSAGQIARSQDGGVTWSVVDLPGTEIARSVFMLDVSRMWIAGDNGYIWFSEDGGLTWVTQSDGAATTEDFRKIFAYDSTHAWAVGTAGAIVATNDGSTWSSQTSGIATELHTIFSITSLLAYAAGAAGQLLKTVDGGLTWTAVSWFGAGTDVIKAITACEDEFVYFGGATAGGAGFIYMSIDGGATAQSLVIPAVDSINDLFCCEPDVLYAAGDESLVIKGS